MNRRIILKASFFRVTIFILLPIVSILGFVLTYTLKGYGVYDYCDLIQNDFRFASKQVIGAVGIVAWIIVFYKPVIKAIRTKFEILGEDGDNIYIYGSKLYNISKPLNISITNGAFGKTLRFSDGESKCSIMLNIADADPEELLVALRNLLSNDRTSG